MVRRKTSQFRKRNRKRTSKKGGRGEKTEERKAEIIIMDAGLREKDNRQEKRRQDKKTEEKVDARKDMTKRERERHRRRIEKRAQGKTKPLPTLTRYPFMHSFCIYTRQKT